MPLSFLAMPKKQTADDNSPSYVIGIDSALLETERVRFFFPNIGDGISLEASSSEEALEKALKIQSDLTSPQ